MPAPLPVRVAIGATSIGADQKGEIVRMEVVAFLQRQGDQAHQVAEGAVGGEVSSPKWSR
jgi:hypothetical protein